MNTSKQINAMIILLALLLVGVGAYTVWDPIRQQDEEDHTRDLIAERAGHTFARNCRVCHGDQGEGRIGPALNPAFRKPPLIDFTDPTKLKENQSLVTNTISCGRIGTVMPPWAIANGGSLNAEQIRQLMILITENPGGDAWGKIVKPISDEENAVATPPPVQDVLKGASITGATTSVCGQKPVGTPTPSVTPTPPPVSTNWTENATDNKFDVTAMAVRANQQATLVFNNKGGALHNWHVLNVKDTSGKDVTFDLTPAGQSKTITFTISQAGAYSFQCDAHPTEMTGTLFVQ